jgi:hypothetical protein
LALSVGFSLTKTDLDNTVGREVGAVWTSLEAIRLRAAWLADSSHNQAFLVALGYSTSEDTQIRAAVNDLDSLRQIAHATGTKGVATIGAAAAANDFFFNAKLLGGVNWYG